MMHWWGGDFGMGFGGGLFMILIWILVILGVVYLVKILLWISSEAGKSREAAREVLEKRFVREEIAKEEFEDAIEVLKRNQA